MRETSSNLVCFMVHHLWSVRVRTGATLGSMAFRCQAPFDRYPSPTSENRALV